MCKQKKEIRRLEIELLRQKIKTQTMMQEGLLKAAEALLKTNENCPEIDKNAPKF